MTTSTDTLNILGIDLGGTATKVGLFRADASAGATGGLELVERVDFTTAAHDFERTEAEILALLSRHGCTPEDIGYLGIAVAAIITPEGSQRFATNIDFDLAEYRGFLEKLLPNARIAAINDANAAALGEAFCHDDYPELLLVTLGTGIGAGFVHDGRVLVGLHGTAGEIGHLCVNPAEPDLCNCGRHGCLEQYSSALGLARMMVAAGRPRPEGAKEVFDAAAAGDPAAKEAVSTFSHMLAFGLAQITCVLDPDLIVLGGGLSASADVFLDDVTRLYREFAFRPCRDVPIGVASLGNSAGIFGAARFALQASDQELS